MVMYQTPNEPTGSNQDIVNEQVGVRDAVVGAVQAADPTAATPWVSFDLEGGGGTDPMTSNPGAYAGMSNVAFDAHFYASNSTDPAASLQQEIAPLASITDQNGQIPVYVGETGDAIDGSNKDPQWQAAMQAAYTTQGGIAWIYDGVPTGAWSSGTDADTLTNSDLSLNDYGQFVAQLIQNNSGSGSNA